MAPLYCKIRREDSIEIETADGKDRLTIEFHRTLRVPDNERPSELPPSLGQFPLSSVAAFKDSLPVHMVEKGGLFLPMYQSEALWVRFESSSRFVIKMYVGGINAISGEKAEGDTGTNLRRTEKLAEDLSLQDYLVVPGQRWLDGIATSDGQVRQFVAMPFGSGYSVEAQVTGQENIGGIQFDVWKMEKTEKLKNLRLWRAPRQGPASMSVWVKMLTGKCLELAVGRYWLISSVKEAIEAEEGFPVDQQRLIYLIYSHEQLDDDKTVNDYNIQPESTLHLVLRLRGGGSGPFPGDMSIAAGGKIYQNIVKDRWPQGHLKTGDCGTFNVQILNSRMYRQVTGKRPPRTPASAKAYSDAGLPFFKLYEEPPSISGNFQGVKSVKAISQAKETEKGATLDTNIEEPIDPMVVVLNPEGPLAPFTPVSVMEEEVKKLNIQTLNGKRPK